ncbi:LysR family transcriptional regulator [Pseudomonas prosekii]|uniref:LysR family transcriptional regulator n=1 Tax=Pseudomonas prosekii TaxID=1148509 RepID=UPI0011EAD198|nr:LysR family transcriptional regulator [Pseudomonas prosekii]
MGSDIAFSSLCSWLRIKHLVLIDTLARTQNMHTAAEQMKLTQPALSKMLRDTEEMLGFRLFERLPRSMPTTELGEQVAHYARVMLNDTEKFVAQVNKLRKGGHGYLKVGAIFAATFNVLPKAISYVKTQRPLLSIEVVEQTSDKLLEMLEQKELDLMVGRFTGDHHRHNFDFSPLGPEPFTLVVNPSHPLAGKDQVEPSELSKWPWVLYPTGTPIRARMNQAFADYKIAPPSNTVETISMPTFLQLLQSGPTIAMLPAPMVQSHLDSGQLQRLHCEFNVAPLEYGVITRKDEILPAAARLFADTLISQCTENKRSRQ